MKLARLRIVADRVYFCVVCARTWQLVSIQRALLLSRHVHALVCLVTRAEAIDAGLCDARSLRIANVEVRGQVVRAGRR